MSRENESQEYLEMALIQWSQQLSVGVDAMDNQHKKLVDMVNQMHDAMSQGQGDAILKQILSALLDYTVRHFRAEEQLMAQHQYPQLAAHQKLHADLTQKATELKEKVDAGKVAVTLQVSTFLKDWLQKHIVGEDKQYGQFISAQLVGSRNE